MIEVKNLTKIYRGDCFETKAIDDVSFSVQDGELLGVVGESGSGKTTLLNMLGGMDRATSGEVLYSGQNIEEYNALKMDAFRKKNIAFVFQHFALMNEFNVYDNLEAPLLARCYKKKDRIEIINDALERFGIADLQNKYPTQISGGQKQRVAITRAMIMDCPYILADEPTGALDEENTYSVMEMFKELNKMGRTIILITHDEIVKQCVNKLITLKDGKIC